MLIWGKVYIRTLAAIWAPLPCSPRGYGHPRLAGAARGRGLRGPLRRGLAGRFSEVQ